MTDLRWPAVHIRPGRYKTIVFERDGRREHTAWVRERGRYDADLLSELTSYKTGLGWKALYAVRAIVKDRRAPEPC